MIIVIFVSELNPGNRADCEVQSEFGRDSTVHTDYMKLQISGQDPASNYTTVTFSADKGKDAWQLSSNGIIIIYL